jgi:hypothetical protein
VSFETDLHTVLSAVCPRVFPDVADNGTQRPYITWQQIGGFAPMYTEGVLPDKRCGFIQVNAWATTRAEAIALALQAEAALVAASQFQAKPQSAFSAAVEDGSDARGTMQDFEIWAPR